MPELRVNQWFSVDLQGNPAGGEATQILERWLGKQRRRVLVNAQALTALGGTAFVGGRKDLLTRSGRLWVSQTDYLDLVLEPEEELWCAVTGNNAQTNRVDFRVELLDADNR